MASRHDTMMTPPIEEPPRSCRLQVHPGHPRRQAGPTDQLVLQPAVRGPWHRRAAAGHLVGPQAALDRLRGDRRRQDPGLLARSRGRGRRGRRRGLRVGRVGRLHPGTMLEGKRIVLGVSGGIAAYKAVEVCRRLVDAGAHVIPVLTDGSLHFIGRTTFDALGSERAWTSLWDEPHPDPAHPPRPDRRPRAGRAGHGAGARALRRGHQRGPAHERAAGHPCPGRSCAPPCTPRCGSTPPCRTTCACSRPAGVHVVEPESGRLAGGDVGAGRLADPQTIVAAVDRAARRRARPRPHRAAGGRHRRRHPRAHRPGPLHRQPLVGQAGPRGRRGGGGPRRQGHPRHHRRPSRPRRGSTSCAWTPRPRWSRPC